MKVKAEEFNIIGDIAGRYDELQLLLKKMPAGATPVSVGDMIDRGPKSKEVLDFFMENGYAVKGNHEHFMQDEMAWWQSIVDGKPCNKLYQKGIWTYCEGRRNHGGLNTLESFGALKFDEITSSHADLDLEAILAAVPQKYLKWIAGLPLYIHRDGLFISHAPLYRDLAVKQCCTYANESWGIMWNRDVDVRRRKEFQVWGHWNLRQPEWYEDDVGKYGVCVDCSRARVLTGVHWPSLQTYEQEYL